MKPQAMALCRVSTKRQLLDGNLEPQEKRIIRAADQLGLEIPSDGWWRVAKSSRKGKNLKRTDLNQMERYGKQHKQVQYLIVDEPDRFMRSIDEYYYWKVKFKMAGVMLIRADKPSLDPNDQNAAFDELIDVYRGEQSNNERITKTPEKQMDKMRDGYYTFAPLPGYRKTDIPSLHEPDPKRFKLLQIAFKSVAHGTATPNEALKKMNADGYTTVNGNQMDMARFRQILVKPYYAGIIQVADWEVASDNGLHEHMITKEEHRAILAIMSGKPKKFAVNKKNPEFPMNETLCFDCQLEQIMTGKLTGYRNHNGKTNDAGDRHYYERYRCRGCKTYFTKEELHNLVSDKLDNTVLDDRELLVKELTSLWRTQVSTNQSKITALTNRKHLLEQQQTDIAAELAGTDNVTVKNAIVAAIEKKEQEKLAIQAEIDAFSDVDAELEGFIAYSLDYTEDLKARYWSLDWDRRKRCELLLYPDGFTQIARKKFTPHEFHQFTETKP